MSRPTLATTNASAPFVAAGVETLDDTTGAEINDTENVQVNSALRYIFIRVPSP